MSSDPGQGQHPPSTPLKSQASGPTSNKRARPTLSCLECRRKKLKCDRAQPCLQCMKVDRQSSCTYASRPLPKSYTRRPSSEDRRRRKKAKANGDPPANAISISDLESQPPRGRGRTSGTPQGRCDLGGRSSNTSLGRIIVKGDRSKYLGFGDRMVILEHFEDASSFIKSAFSAPDMTDIMAELYAFQRTFQARRMHREIHPPLNGLSLGRPGLLASMLNSFPSEESLCSVSINTYNTYWETLIRVFHLSCLNKDRPEIFNERCKGVFSLPPNIKEGVVPQLLSLMALSARLSNRSISAVDRFTEEQVMTWTDLTQKWVDDLRGKEKLNLATLKAQLLLLLVHQNNLTAPVELWQKSGNLVRNAMVMGLHHDPEDCSGFSLFEKEQRRKLWRSIVEVEIQFSLATGMPAAIRSSDFNARDLLNVDDVDLSEDMTEYPPGKPQHQWTDSTPQMVLGVSLKERLDAINILGGSIDLEKDADALLIRARDLERYLQLLPSSIRSTTTSGRNGEKSPGRLFTQIMLDVFIRRPALAIYRTIALSPLSSRYPEARRAAVQSSIAMLSHLDALDPTVADLNIIKDRDLLNHFHVLCKNDIIQAAIMLCVEIRRFSLVSRDPDSEEGIQEETPWTKHSLARIVDNTLSSLLQRVGAFGSDLKDILPLSVVLQCARSDGTPEERRDLMRNGAERILNACRKFSQLPKVGPSDSQNGNEQDTDVPPTSSVPPLPFYWQAESNPNVLPTHKQASNSGIPSTISEDALFDVDDAFEDFDFGSADWGLGGPWF